MIFMKRFAANKIYLSADNVTSNAYMQVSSESVLEKVVPLKEAQECHSTPFYNGILLPVPEEEVSSYKGCPLNKVFRELFGERKISEGSRVEGVTLVYGKGVLVNQDDCEWQCRGL